MPDVLIPYSPTGKSKKLVPFAFIAAGTVLSLNLGAVASAAATFSTSAAATDLLAGDMDQLHLKTNVANAFSLSGARFKRAGQDYIVKADGSVQVNPSPVTGNGTTVGTMTPAQGEVLLNAWEAGGSPAVSDWRGVAAAPINGADTPFTSYAVTFRTPVAPLRTGSLSVLGTMQDGTTFNVTADSNGYINTARIKGRANYTTGVVTLVGVTPSGAGGQTQTDLSFLGIPGVGNAFIDLIRQETLRFNAVAFTYLPLDAALLGINPVRLPSDGRVPIFKAAGFVVVGHKAATAPAPAVNGGTVDCGRTRLSRVRVIGADGETIETGYTVDREAGIVTWVDVTGYSQPVRVEHRIEDMGQLREAGIDGTLVMLRALSHNYPLGSYVSSAFVAADMRSRVSLLFDQATWNPQTFTDALSGAEAPAAYNDIGYPVRVLNDGAVTERWVLLFKTNQTVDVIGEHVGNLGTFSINTDIAPIDGITGKPYFLIPYQGWGSGWAPGNLVRMNTVAAIAPFWLAQTIKQGPAAGEDYTFSVLVRGNIDNPI
ncbi:hypothetical protein J2W34_000738 [Variovorax boronicumulans]|uniref:hypothetical protein n=1 Tax=Variovorax boronicumulans TaxID=436515 RepID=UPI002788BCAC|nr:hypothetical protein [Variovorax boronicumulans]MDQ0068964.1 hypothetical protein [Variovorax boronicumulans]